MKPANSLPSQQYLQECFKYNRHTGELRWKKRPREHFPNIGAMAYTNKILAGKPVGQTKNKKPSGLIYLYVTINSKRYPVHRVIFKWVTGRDPEGVIDHINRVPTDNRWCNLREATQSQNAANSRFRANSHTKVKGVHYVASSKKYRAQIRHNGKLIHLGCFKSVDDARLAYTAKAKELFGKFSDLTM